MLTSESFAALLLANALYSVAWGFYTYITFLGYMGACVRLPSSELLVLDLTCFSLITQRCRSCTAPSAS